MTGQVKEIVPRGKIKIEHFFEFPLKCLKFIGLILIPSTDHRFYVQLKERLLKGFFFFCAINSWLFILALASRAIVSITDIPVLIRVLPNVTNIPYNNLKSLLNFIQILIILILF